MLLHVIYLGTWQLNDLKEAISSEAVLAGTRFAGVTTLLLLSEEEDEDEASLEKAVKYSPQPLVGDAKGLSGRLCSKLHLNNFINIFYQKQIW